MLVWHPAPLRRRPPGGRPWVPAWTGCLPNARLIPSQPPLLVSQQAQALVPLRLELPQRLQRPGQRRRSQQLPELSSSRQDPVPLRRAAWSPWPSRQNRQPPSRHHPGRGRRRSWRGSPAEKQQRLRRALRVGKSARPARCRHPAHQAAAQRPTQPSPQRPGQPTSRRPGQPAPPRPGREPATHRRSRSTTAGAGPALRLPRSGGMH
jgi:hypothetical protein